MQRRVAVVMGGESRERDVSRVTGTAVAKALAERAWDVVLVDTESGIRPVGEGPSPTIGTQPPETSAVDVAMTAGPQAIADFVRSLGDVDVIFVALHGGWGEDGTIQALFDLIGIPYTGSGVLGSALSMDKHRAKCVMRARGFATPEWALTRCAPGASISAPEVARLRAMFAGDVVVKPNAEGSTVGLTVVRAGDDFHAALDRAARFDERVLVEQFIEGRELTVTVLGHEALPIVEIIPEGGVYTYEAKYTKGHSRYECPAKLPEELAAQIRAAAVATYDELGCEGYARLDYRLSADGSFYCLEANTVPGMTPLSLVPMAAKAAGLSFGELVERILELAVARGPRRRRNVTAGV